MPPAYEAKTTGRDMARFYSIETDQRAVARQTMAQQLCRALERHELSLHHQPRLSAQGAQLLGVGGTRCAGRSPVLGSIPPSEFIPIAEETGMIRAIGSWRCNRPCEQWVRWQQLVLDAGVGDAASPHPLARVSISVNLSAAQMSGPRAGRRHRGAVVPAPACPRTGWSWRSPSPS